MSNDSGMPEWKSYLNDLIAAEVSTLARFCDRVIQYRPLAHDFGHLLSRVAGAEKQSIDGIGEISEDEFPPDGRVAFLLNGNLNHTGNIDQFLAELQPVVNRGSRIMAICYNPYLAGLYKLANAMGIRKSPLPENFLTMTSLKHICRVAGYEVVRLRLVGYLPFRWLGVGEALNRLLPFIPLIRWLSYMCLVTLRPVIAEPSAPSISIIIPARNERGNIGQALQSLPRFEKADVQVIFIEGHSTDGTWEEIQRIAALDHEGISVQALQQEGKGKNDAVRCGLKVATGELVTILDADLTMPPECLEQFYRAYSEGMGDFINGNRLVYKMEHGAMRFLNKLGNSFFAKLLSRVLQVEIGDALCGTKLLTKRDYERIGLWRNHFGDYDPFGDFDLLFAAAELSLGVVDVPITYAARRYGSTNISRFRDGLKLARMSFVGWLKIRLGKSTGRKRSD